ncbi:MAG: LuxR C-terminal-related transcriptional regulator [Polyangiaceae bacterium]
MSPPLQVLLVVPDTARRRALARELGELGTFLTHRAASDSASVPASELDAAIVQDELPDGTGLAVVARLRAEAPGLPVMVLARLNEGRVVQEALRLEVELAEVPPRTATLRSFLEALDERRAEAIERLADRWELSDRERVVLALAAQGLTYPMIADALKLSKNTLRTYRERIARKAEASGFDQVLQQLGRRRSSRPPR